MEQNNMIEEITRTSEILHAIGEVVAIGFTAGAIAGIKIFLLNWLLATAINIFKIPMKGD
jgi:hypothetical protein